MDIRTKNNYFNQEGYADPTPYDAIKNEYFRGEIFDQAGKDELYLIVSPEHRNDDYTYNVIDDVVISWRYIEPFEEVG